MMTQITITITSFISIDSPSPLAIKLHAVQGKLSWVSPLVIIILSISVQTILLIIDK